MKRKRFLNLGLAFILALLSVFGNVPAYARTHPNMPPVSEKVVLDLYPLENTLNPLSPKYNPNDRYGGEGTRFGPPGKRTPAISLNSVGDQLLAGIDHVGWGAGIPDDDEMIGVRAYQRAYSNLNVNNGDKLYAPTLMAPNDGSVESVTYYHGTLFGTSRYWGVWDHTIGNFGGNGQKVNQTNVRFLSHSGL